MKQEKISSLITDIRHNQGDYGSGVFVVMVLVMVLECTCPE